MAADTGITTTVASNAMLNTAVNGPHAVVGTELTVFSMVKDTGSSIEIGKAGVTVIFTMKFGANSA